MKHETSEREKKHEAHKNKPRKHPFVSKPMKEVVSLIVDLKIDEMEARIWC